MRTLYGAKLTFFFCTPPAMPVNFTDIILGFSKQICIHVFLLSTVSNYKFNSYTRKFSKKYWSQIFCVIYQYFYCFYAKRMCSDMFERHKLLTHALRIYLYISAIFIFCDYICLHVSIVCMFCTYISSHSCLASNSEESLDQKTSSDQVLLLK